MFIKWKPVSVYVICGKENKKILLLWNANRYFVWNKLYVNVVLSLNEINSKNDINSEWRFIRVKFKGRLFLNDISIFWICEKCQSIFNRLLPFTCFTNKYKDLTARLDNVYTEMRSM